MDLKNTNTVPGVVFIMGVAHSGTTILYNMLAQHPDIGWFSQYAMRGGEIPGRKKLPGYITLEKVLSKIFPVSWKKETSWLDIIIPRPMEPHKIWDFIIPEKHFLQPNEYDQSHVDRARFIIDQQKQRSGKDVLLVKIPRLTNSLPVLARIFPRAFFISITRDGKAVTVSNKHKFMRGATSSQQAITESATHWRDTVTYVRQHIQDIPERSMEIVHEDFCHDVHGALRDICAQIGVSVSDDYLDHFPTTLRITNEKHFKNLSSQDKHLINDMLGDTLPKFGYDLFS